MRGGALVPSDVRKEVRALAGAWLACLIAVTVPLMSGIAPLRQLAIPAYFIGAAALGALAIGHEYSHGTLALLLSQPVSRRRHLVVKLGVLAVVLLPLTAIAVTTVDLRAGVAATWAFALLPVLCALFVAPWLTMWCRSPIAGAVFTLALPGLMFLAGALLPFEANGKEMDRASEMIVLWLGTLALCAVGAVMTWRMFMRLEATGDSAPYATFSYRFGQSARAASSTSAVTRQHPIWLLVKKELQLQQLAMALAGLYLLAWLAIVFLPYRIASADDLLTVLTLFYGVLIPMATGSLASAEERRLGTLEWQLLLPVASGAQWLVKVGVALGLALLLALGLPLVLLAFMPADQGLMATLVSRPIFIVALTVISLYVSSLCTSGLRALIVSMPATFASIISVGILAQWLVSSGSVLFSWSSPAGMLARTSREMMFQVLGVSAVEHTWLMSALQLLLVVALLAMVLSVAGANHRSAQPADGRIWRQLTVVTLGLSAGAVALATLAALEGSRPPRLAKPTVTRVSAMQTTKR